MIMSARLQVEDCGPTGDSVNEDGKSDKREHDRSDSDEV